MAKSLFETNPAFAKLGDDTRKSVAQAFDAMSDWRKELAEMGEKNSNAVFDKMADAAKALGWPTDFVELSRKQMMSASKLQLQAIDQVMHVWEKQLTSLGSMPEMPKFPGMPNFPGMTGSPMGGGFQGFPDLASSPMAPLQMWMQAAEMWQKTWQQAMSSWVDAQNKAMNKSGPGSSKY
jgi:hypothetical protein